MNDLSIPEAPSKPAFDFRLVSNEQAMELREISVRLSIRVQRTAEEMLAMGADLQQAKKVCKEDGKTFTAWCESAECPVGYSTAKRLMSVAERIPQKKTFEGLFDSGLNVLAEVTQTREEDIRAALLDHIEKEAENGKKVTQKEITALKKALKEAQAEAGEFEDMAFNASAALQAEFEKRQKAEQREKEAEAKKEQFVKDLLEADKERKRLATKIKEQQEALKDAEEVHREHLEEMRQQIAEEERKRPRTDVEQAEHERKLKELKDAAANVQVEINRAAKEREKLLGELNDTRKELAFRDQVLSDFSKAASRFRETCLLMSGAASALKQTPVTDELYQQLEMIREMAQSVIDEARAITSVR